MIFPLTMLMGKTFREPLPIFLIWAASQADIIAGEVSGTIVIKKVTIPAGGPEFGFTQAITEPGAFSLSDGETETFSTVAAGSYTVSEDDPLSLGYTLTGLSCDDTEAGIPSTADLAKRTATIQLDSGETVTCTFTNEKSDNLVKIEKSTNGADADNPPGLTIAVGAAVKWIYVVTNTAGEALQDIVVTDDQGVVVTCPKNALAAGESMTCTASGTAAAGQYRNVGLVTANTKSGATTRASDPSHYLGQASGAAIDIETLTNSVDADVSPGPSVPVGAPVTWSYDVTNTGNVTLTSVMVTDNQGVTVNCPADFGGDGGGLPKTTLAVGESMTCTASGTAMPGQYSNIGTATATGSTVTDSDPSHYFGAVDEDAQIDLEKLTNSQDADLPPGPSIPVGDSVTWTYKVTNTGDVSLSGIVVSDDRGVAVSCPKTTLAPGESMDCTGTGTVVQGPYRNVGKVAALSPSKRAVSDSDLSHHLGQVSQAATAIEKSTNGEDADSAPGPKISARQFRDVDLRGDQHGQCCPNQRGRYR